MTDICLFRASLLYNKIASRGDLAYFQNCFKEKGLDFLFFAIVNFFIITKEPRDLQRLL